MKLKVATEADIDHLMSWFPTERSVNVWGGPKFRYPFTPETFHDDVHWRDMDSYFLLDADDEMLAFGQIYERHCRINLARLVVSPARRNEGIGRQLVSHLMNEGQARFALAEFSLFVYRDNYPAIACYEGLGFEQHEYPEDDEMADSCFYMTRPVNIAS
jgi:ribosomal protein S18 acetylase RimI-like enzyme